MVMRGRQTTNADLIARIKELEQQVRELQGQVAAMPRATSPAPQGPKS